jgi:hypothetical protein
MSNRHRHNGQEPDSLRQALLQQQAVQNIVAAAQAPPPPQTINDVYHHRSSNAQTHGAVLPGPKGPDMHVVGGFTKQEEAALRILCSPLMGELIRDALAKRGHYCCVKSAIDLAADLLAQANPMPEPPPATPPEPTPSIIRPDQD